MEEYKHFPVIPPFENVIGLLESLDEFSETEAALAIIDFWDARLGGRPEVVGKVDTQANPAIPCLIGRVMRWQGKRYWFEVFEAINQSGDLIELVLDVTVGQAPKVRASTPYRIGVFS